MSDELVFRRFFSRPARPPDGPVFSGRTRRGPGRVLPTDFTYPSVSSPLGFRSEFRISNSPLATGRYRR